MLVETFETFLWWWLLLNPFQVILTAVISMLVSADYLSHSGCNFPDSWCDEWFFFFLIETWIFWVCCDVTLDLISITCFMWLHLTQLSWEKSSVLQLSGGDGSSDSPFNVHWHHSGGRTTCYHGVGVGVQALCKACIDTLWLEEAKVPHFCSPYGFH